MAKKKQTVPPQSKTSKGTSQSNLTYILLAILLTVIVGYIFWQHSISPQQTVNTVSSAKQIVARTEPEIGEALTTSIIKTQADGAIETSITLHAAQKPEVIDITADLTTSPTESVLTKDLQQASIARATLELAKKLQASNAAQTAPAQKNVTQALMVLALYSALNTGAPETMALAIQIGAEDLSASLAQYGPLTLADVLLHAGVHTVNTQQKTQMKKQELTLPSWWQRTLGKFIQVTKAQKTEEMRSYSAMPINTDINDALPRLLKQGEWQMAEQEMLNMPESAYKTLANAYITQRKAMAYLLGKTLGVK